MARMTLDKGFSVDRRRALIQMSADGKPLAHMIFDGAALEAQIRDLALFRSNILEPVPEDLDPDTDIEVQRSPAWRIPDVHSGPKQDVMLALRHTGFGWLAFMLEPDRARALGEALIANADGVTDNL